jgi:hypothetical protein
MVNSGYIECVEAGDCAPRVFTEQTYHLSSAGMFLASILTFVKLFRNTLVLFVIAVLVAACHTVPSNELPDEWTTLVRVGAYVVLYYVSLVVTACYSVVETRSNTGVVKVLQSQWCLFINNPYLLVLMAVTQGMIAAIFIYFNVHNLEHIRYNEDPVKAHTEYIEEPVEESGSDV